MQKDFIYEEELKGWERAGVITTLAVAFSRDGDKKDYVQHHIQKRGKEVWDVLVSGEEIDRAKPEAR